MRRGLPGDAPGERSRDYIRCCTRERVRPLTETLRVERRRTCRERRAIQAARVGHVNLVRREREARAGDRHGSARTTRDRRLRRSQIDDPRRGRRRRVGVADRVGHAHLERVTRFAQPRGRERRRAARECARIEQALIRRARAGVGRGEREHRSRTLGRCGRSGDDLGIGRARVHGPRIDRGRIIDVARAIVSAHRERMRAVADRTELLTAGAGHEPGVVEIAIEPRVVFVRAELEHHHHDVVGGRRRLRQDRVRRDRVDRPQIFGRRLVGHAVGVGRAHRE